MLEDILPRLSADEVARLRAIYEPLTQSVRELIDATVRTETAADTVASVRAEIDAATARLRANQLEGSFGVRFGAQGSEMPWGNAVIGVRNPIAPPVDLIRAEDGSVSADFHLGAAYEGPPGHVHGGVSAMILDHVLGEGASLPGRPRLTGTLTTRYRRMTRLGALHTEARIVRTEGIKTYAVGHIADAEGITVEAEGVFITPRWARD
ncbi:PaaI family thioesterase [Mycolicibacterium aubagnense]|uniref:Acyl-coenzyme A thioesterase THEM4 n=1 Tax=Mycolicibacterium aubagnense TaxID=319707 RepID=A0ABM7I8H6_9MYCO|nr:PaaI family thioesterase [Mycolicibacterium aubagnense]WGI35230.1 PaaI family thioesterase [Mycolicibacterium aubagnense]BBX82816.1 thioesterase [Mycolicibacterium aubagnense]